MANFSTQPRSYLHRLCDILLVFPAVWEFCPLRPCLFPHKSSNALSDVRQQSSPRPTPTSVNTAARMGRMQSEPTHLQTRPTIQAHVPHPRNPSKVADRTREEIVSCNRLYRDDQPLAFRVPLGCAKPFSEREPECHRVVRRERGKAVTGFFVEGLGGQFCVAGGVWERGTR